MSYIVQRNNRFYVVAYDGHDPITGRERRRWHPAGTKHGDAEMVQRRIDDQRPTPTCERSVGGFMSTTWLATKTTLTGPTASRYRWMINHNIASRIGMIRLDTLRPADLDGLYPDLIASGGCRREKLAPKTVLEVHRVICNALDLVAHTGMGRGELAGLNWGDLDLAASSLSIARTRQVTMGRTVEGPVKTRTSRRRINLDSNTTTLLEQWRQRLVTEGATLKPSTPMFLNAHHQTPSPESYSQLFTRTTATTGLPRIRFHDLRHTHASLLVAAGVPIKVVSERLGHAHPGFTMHTYQRLLPAWAPRPPPSSRPSSTRTGRRLPPRC